MTRVMAVDAGQSTGVAIYDFPEGKVLRVKHTDQFKANVADTVRHLDGLTYDYEPNVVVVEQFDLRPSNQFVADLTTVEVNGALKYAWGEDIIVWQTPAQAKGLVSDEVLKNLDLWHTGSMVGAKDANDVNDASRHAIRYAVEVLKHRHTIRKGWPKEEEDA